MLLLTEMSEEGKAADPQWLEKNVWMIRKKKRLFKLEPSMMIVWDPSEYTFDWNGRQVTVKDYFQEHYGIQLKYPQVRNYTILHD